MHASQLTLNRRVRSAAFGRVDARGLLVKLLGNLLEHGRIVAVAGVLGEGAAIDRAVTKTLGIVVRHAGENGSTAAALPSLLHRSVEAKGERRRPITLGEPVKINGLEHAAGRAGIPLRKGRSFRGLRVRNKAFCGGRLWSAPSSRGRTTMKPWG